ncbi:hypothetical protein [Mesorhizobium sp.]|uniref:hypothetical protein n=1 Tax=Mesorhizobium sp. TaxID=1871066 RepID=UPI0012000E8E|nr:hypothetical protein [Mesorhizobium sp.]TIO07784.1 MAG: hypothetical protein E5X88_17200 [Mesorhizobium sp.]TIO30955.1 MAG: hypothetical protein E5X89_25785 [Mesorhizobium sp.]
MLSAVANAVLCVIVRKGGDTIAIGTNQHRLTSLTQLHLKVTPLGLPRTIGNEETMAVIGEL